MRADKCAHPRLRHGTQTIYHSSAAYVYGNSNGNGNVALLAETLETLVAGLLVLQDEAAPLGLQIKSKDTDSAGWGTTSDPIDSPGGQGWIKILWCP